MLLGNGDGSFQAARNFAVPGFPVSVAAGDFNGDGFPDLAVASSQSSHVSVLLGNGDGTFQGATFFVAGNAPWSVAVGDFNGDEQQDLAVANYNGVAVLLGNGDGSFRAPNFTAALGPLWWTTSMAMGCRTWSSPTSAPMSRC